jgi:alkylation response protein AidB-like acyl-CoA dehydrogenase
MTSSATQTPALPRRSATPLFDDEHEALRESFRTFLEREIVPNFEAWERDGIVPREVFTAAGSAGFLAPQVPEEYGGAGAEDFRFNVVIGEEVTRAGVPGFGLGLTLHNDVCAPYILEQANEEQKQRWLPGIVSGDILMAIAMTEPQAGSDLAALTTRGRPTDDGWVVNGSKTFISNGINGDLIITAVRTGPGERHKDVSLLALEGDMEGLERGRNLEKIGMHAQDTAELFFNDVAVPRANLLGEEGHGFRYLMTNLAQERLSIAVASMSAARAAFEWTVAYAKERHAFGQSVAAFQHSRFQLAHMATRIEVAQSFLDDCIRELDRGELTAERAAMAKLWTTEVQGRAVDLGVQMHGGYGYMLEYPIARAYADARITRIYGGTSEIMQEIIARSIGL